MNSEILDDKRTIQSFQRMPYGEEGDYWKVGFMKCTAIEVYGEPGPEFYAPWIKVSIGGEIRLRFPAAHGEIQYAAGPKKGDNP